MSDPSILGLAKTTSEVHGTPEPSRKELAHHFEDLDQQRECATLGMWAFLVNEILFFGVLFTGYAVYRFLYPQAFAEGSAQLSVAWGGINTAVLICSSLTMALAVQAAAEGNNRGVIRWIGATVVFGLAFLGIKAVEYTHKWHAGLVPGDHFSGEGFTPGEERHVELFYSFYYAMTGMHALHMVIGFGLMAWLVVLARRNRFTKTYSTPVELVGLYWHFVDIVWIFLFPLLYLVGRHTGS